MYHKTLIFDKFVKKFHAHKEMSYLSWLYGKRGATSTVLPRGKYATQVIEVTLVEVAPLSICARRV